MATEEITAAQARTLIAEREALQEMVRTEGWQVFLRHIRDEWGGGRGYFHKMDQVLTSDQPAEAMVIHRVAKEIDKLICWPRSRVETLKGVPEE